MEQRPPPVGFVCYRCRRKFYGSYDIFLEHFPHCQGMTPLRSLTHYTAEFAAIISSGVTGVVIGSTCSSKFFLGANKFFTDFAKLAKDVSSFSKEVAAVAGDLGTVFSTASHYLEAGVPPDFLSKIATAMVSSEAENPEAPRNTIGSQ